MAASPTAYPALVISPNTLSDLTVILTMSTGTVYHYTLSDFEVSTADYYGCLMLFLDEGFTTKNSNSASGTAVIESTGCQTQTLTINAVTYYEITMEPAPGYKKLYAWNKNTAGMFSTVPEYIYTTEYPVTEGCAIYDASGNLISNDATSVRYSGTDGEIKIYANCDDWNSDPFSGGVEE